MAIEVKLPLRTGVGSGQVPSFQENYVTLYAGPDGDLLMQNDESRTIQLNGFKHPIYFPENISVGNLNIPSIQSGQSVIVKCRIEGNFYQPEGMVCFYKDDIPTPAIKLGEVQPARGDASYPIIPAADVNQLDNDPNDPWRHLLYVTTNYRKARRMTAINSGRNYGTWNYDEKFGVRETTVDVTTQLVWSGVSGANSGYSGSYEVVEQITSGTVTNVDYMTGRWGVSYAGIDKGHLVGSWKYGSSWWARGNGPIELGGFTAIESCWFSGEGNDNIYFNMSLSNWGSGLSSAKNVKVAVYQ